MDCVTSAVKSIVFMSILLSSCVAIQAIALNCEPSLPSEDQSKCFLILHRLQATTELLNAVTGIIFCLKKSQIGK